jgi:hypothetical protein
VRLAELNWLGIDIRLAELNWLMIDLRLADWTGLGSMWLLSVSFGMFGFCLINLESSDHHQESIWFYKSADFNRHRSESNFCQ